MAAAAVALPQDAAPPPRRSRWSKRTAPPPSVVVAAPPAELCAPPSPAHPAAAPRRQRAAAGPSYIMQHYHSTGCAGGAFSWRAALLDPWKAPHACLEPREYRETTAADIELSKADKRGGGGPRVGPFQEAIPGGGWRALPKYDYTTRNRSCAYNERMHVEWENHVDHILSNGGEPPVASVVAKAGFRSCAPCCRDMLALARPTGKTFIMVDLAEDDKRGTFHFVVGDRYLPVPKEACSEEEVAALKRVVSRAQGGGYASGIEIHDAVLDLGAPIDEVAQAFYLGDRALLPAGCARDLKGAALLGVLHAEHFARLPAEYGASILRDPARPEQPRRAVEACRALAKKALVDAWAPHLAGQGINLEAYAAAAVAPMLPDDASEYQRLRRGLRPAAAAAPAPSPGAPRRYRVARLGGIDERRPSAPKPAPWEAACGEASLRTPAPPGDDDGASTAVPDDAASSASDDGPDDAM